MISQTQINTYINCSKKYYWKYVKKIAPSNDISISGLFTGLFFHKAIEKYLANGSVDYNVVLKDVLKNWFDLFHTTIDGKIDLSPLQTDKEILDYCKNNMKERYYKEIFEDEIEELKTKTNVYLSLFKTGKEITNKFIEEINNGFFSDIKSFALEKEIVYNDLLGYLDMIGISRDDKLIVIDFKISKRGFDFKKRIQDLQYCYMIYKTTGQIPVFRYVSISYNNKNGVETNIEQRDFEYSVKEILQFEEYIEAFQNGVKNNVFMRNENSFLCSPDFCQYYDICMLQKEGMLN